MMRTDLKCLPTAGEEARNAVETLTQRLAFGLLSRAVVQVRITRKLAGALNGLDLRPFVVGEVVDLDPLFARMLVSEGWAEVHQENTASDERKDRPSSNRHN